MIRVHVEAGKNTKTAVEETRRRSKTTVHFGEMPGRNDKCSSMKNSLVGQSASGFSDKAKGCEKMLQIDQIRYELGSVKSSLSELGESL